MLYNKPLVLGARLPIIVTFLLLFFVDIGAIPLVANSLPPDIIFIPTLFLVIASFYLAPICSYFYLVRLFRRNSSSASRKSSLIFFLVFDLSCFLPFYAGYFFATRTISFGRGYVSIAYLVAAGIPTLLSFVLGSSIAKREEGKDIQPIRTANL